LHAANIVALNNNERQEESTLRELEGNVRKLDFKQSRFVLLEFTFSVYAISITLVAILTIAYFILSAENGIEDMLNELFAIVAMFLIFDEAHKAGRCCNRHLRDPWVQNSLNRFASYSRQEEDDSKFIVTNGEDPRHEAPAGDIFFNDISVFYPDVDLPVVQKVSFRIPQGGSVAFAAESGAGKSTLLKAMVGHFQFERTISFGYVELSRETRSRIRERLGVVTSEITLYSRSVNIAYSYDSADEAKILDVLEKVGLPGWVNRFQMV